MAEILIDEFYCPDSSSTDDGDVRVWLDEKTDTLRSDSSAYYIADECNQYRPDIIHEYCNTSTGKNMRVRKKNSSPFAYVEETGTLCEHCDVTLQLVSVTNESVKGAADGEAVVETNGEYTSPEWFLNGVAYTFTGYAGHFTDLAAGDYEVVLKYSSICSARLTFTINSGADIFKVSCSATKTTAEGKCDGSVSLSISGGMSGRSYDVYWADQDGVTGPMNRTGLCAGTYSYTVKDTSDYDLAVSGSCTVSNPTPEPETDGRDIFYAAGTQAIRFIQPVSDGPCNPHNIDNVLYNNVQHAGVEPKCYEQKYQHCDVVGVQVASNCTHNTVTVKDWNSGAVMLTTLMTKTAKFSGINETNTGYLKSNGDGSTRVYFDTADFPVPIAVGDVVEIQGTVESNGTYGVQGVFKEEGGSQYMLISLAYAEVSATTACTVLTFFNKRDFDIYVAYVNWERVPSGVYQVVLSGLDSAGIRHEYVSEPQRIKEKWNNTVLIRYRHSKTTFDLYYANGFVNTLRVEGTLFHLQPAFEKRIHIDCGKVVALGGEYIRNVELKTYAIPMYLHERVGVALAHDFFEIDGIEYQIEGGYQQPRYLYRTLLANSSAILRQAAFAQVLRGSGSSLLEGDGDGGGSGGSGSGDGLIIQDTGFIRY